MSKYEQDSEAKKNPHRGGRMELVGHGKYDRIR